MKIKSTPTPTVDAFVTSAKAADADAKLTGAERSRLRRDVRRLSTEDRSRALDVLRAEAPRAAQVITPVGRATLAEFAAQVETDRKVGSDPRTTSSNALREAGLTDRTRASFFTLPQRDQEAAKGLLAAQGFTREAVDAFFAQPELPRGWQSSALL